MLKFALIEMFLSPKIYAVLYFFAAQRGRNLPGEFDPQPGRQGFFAAPSLRRERSDSRVRLTRCWAALPAPLVSRSFYLWLNPKPLI